MEYNISRRSFMQGAGVVALSIACSGMLTGCGSSSGDSVGDYSINLSNEYEVNISDKGSSATYSYEPTIDFERSSGDGDKMTYSSLFSVYINGAEIKPSNGDEKVNLEKGWLKSHKKATATPKFTIDSTQYDAIKNDGAEIKLYVMPYGSKNYATVVYTISIKEKTVTKSTSGVGSL